MRTVKAAFSRARKRGYLRENPADEVKQVREPERTIRVLDEGEIGKLLSACPSTRWRALVVLALTTGMRLGELTALRWKDVDMDSGTIVVCSTEAHATKSRRNRTLALLPEVGELLRKLPKAGEVVFATARGERIAHNVARDFGAIIKRSGIPRCTFHDLRRAFISQLAMAGVTEAVAQKLAGHASIMTTVKHYTAIMPESLRAAQERLPYRDVVSDASDTYQGRNASESSKKAKITRLYAEVS